MSQSKEWAPQDIPQRSYDIISKTWKWTHPSFVVFGESGSGKTAIALAVLRALSARYPKVVWFTLGGGDTAKLFLPECVVHRLDQCDTNGKLLLDAYLDEQERVRDDPRVDSRLMIVLDDVTWSEELTKKVSPIGKAITRLAQQGRHYNTSLMILSHSVTSLHPAMRKNIMVALMLRPTGEDSVRQLHELYGAGMSLTEWRDYFRENTEDNTAVVFDKFQDGRLQTYNAKNKLTAPSGYKYFRLGCRELWGEKNDRYPYTSKYYLN